MLKFNEDRTQVLREDGSLMAFVCDPDYTWIKPTCTGKRWMTIHAKGNKTKMSYSKALKLQREHFRRVPIAKLPEPIKSCLLYKISEI